MPASSNIASTSSSSRESRWSSKQFSNGGNQMQVTTISKEGCFGRSKGNTDAAVIRLGHWSSGSSCSSTSHSTSSMSYSRSSMSSSTVSSSSSSAMSSSSRSAISSSLDQRSSAQKQSSSSRSRSAILSSIGQTSSAQKQSLSSSSRSAISSSGDQVSNGEKQLSYSRSRSAISYTADQISSGEKQSSSSNSRSTTESSADQILNAQNQTSLSSSRSSTSSSADQLSIEEKQLSYSRSRSAISSSGDQLSRREMQSSSSDSRSIISFSDDQMSSGEMQSSSSSSRSEILFSGDQILSAQKQSTSSNSRSAIAASDDSISSARNKSSSASSKSKISSSADQMLSAQKQSSLSNSRSAIAASDEQTLGAQKKSSVYSSKSAISPSVDQMSLEEKQTSSSSSKSEISSSADQMLGTQRQSKLSNTRSAIAVSDEQILSARNKSSLSCSKSEISSSADQMLGTQRQSKSSNSRSAIAASDEQTLNAQKKSSVYSSKSEISSSADQICAQKQSLSSSSRSQMSSSDDQMSSGQKQLSSFSSGIISSSIDQISVVQTQSSSSSRSVISSSFGQMSSAHKQSSLGAKSSLRKICSRSKAKEGCECVNLHGRLTECEIMWYRLRDLMLNIHTERADVIREICRISEDTMFRKCFANTTIPSDQCISHVFPCSNYIVGNLILTVLYGFTLAFAAKLISDGAELLLDVGLPPALIGGAVLPVLGAIPDAAMIVASGLGSKEEAEEQISVGMGTLAGSSILLLTLAWSASLVFGKVDIIETPDQKPIGIDHTSTVSFFKQGVEVTAQVRVIIFGMIVTCLPYVIIQSNDFWGLDKSPKVTYLMWASGISLVLCTLGFAGYIIWQIITANEGENANIIKHEIIKDQNKMYHHAVRAFMANKQFSGVKIHTDSQFARDHETMLAQKYFNIWKNKTFKKQEVAVNVSSGSKDDDDDEEPRWKIGTKAGVFLTLGVGLVTFFSDPMCATLTALTNKNYPQHIPISPFYLSFIVTPLCSNASELISSLIFASKKEKSSSSVTFSQLYGAAVMNNTMCLGVFCVLILVRQLTWDFSAEISAILITQLVVGVVALFSGNVYRTTLVIPIALLYFFALGLTAVLENVFHWS